MQSRPGGIHGAGPEIEMDQRRMLCWWSRSLCLWGTIGGLTRRGSGVRVRRRHRLSAGRRKHRWKTVGGQDAPRSFSGLCVAGAHTGRFALRRLNMTSTARRFRTSRRQPRRRQHFHPTNCSSSQAWRAAPTTATRRVVTAASGHAYLSAAEGIFAKAAVANCPSSLSASGGDRGGRRLRQASHRRFWKERLKAARSRTESTTGLLALSTGTNRWHVRDASRLLLGRFCNRRTSRTASRKGDAGPARPIGGPGEPPLKWLRASPVTIYVAGHRARQDFAPPICRSGRGQLERRRKSKSRSRDVEKDPGPKAAVSNFHTSGW